MSDIVARLRAHDLNLCAEWKDDEDRRLWEDTADSLLLEAATRIENYEEPQMALDVCCCGDDMGNHSYCSGHSPVSQYYWRVHKLEERVKELELKEKLYDDLNAAFLRANNRLREAYNEIQDLEEQLNDYS